MVEGQAEEIGQRIREVRRMLGLTGAQLGIALNVGQTTISRIELGKSAPSYELFLVLSERFGVSLEWLLRGEMPRFRTTARPPLPGHTEVEQQAMATAIAAVETSRAVKAATGEDWRSDPRMKNWEGSDEEAPQARAMFERSLAARSAQVPGLNRPAPPQEPSGDEEGQEVKGRLTRSTSYIAAGLQELQGVMEVLGEVGLMQVGRLNAKEQQMLGDLLRLIRNGDEDFVTRTAIYLNIFAGPAPGDAPSRRVKADDKSAREAYSAADPSEE